jgi:hypothetical protein
VVDSPIAYMVAEGSTVTMEATRGTLEPNGFTIITSCVAAWATCAKADNEIMRPLIVVLDIGAIM